MAEEKTINIHGLQFAVPAPYAEGMQINENEAKVLNQTRAENIANNFRARIKKLVEGAEDAESEDAIREAFAAYAADYVFNAPRASATMLSPLEKEALRQARAWLVVQLKATDFKTVKAYKEAKGEDFVEGKIAEIAENPEIVKLAKKAIADAEKLAATAASIDLNSEAA